jgi:hypothetical protein
MKLPMAEGAAFVPSALDGGPTAMCCLPEVMVATGELAATGEAEEGPGGAPGWVGVAGGHIACPTPAVVPGPSSLPSVQTRFAACSSSCFRFQAALNLALNSAGQRFAAAVAAGSGRAAGTGCCLPVAKDGAGAETASWAADPGCLTVTGCCLQQLPGVSGSSTPGYTHDFAVANRDPCSSPEQQEHHGQCHSHTQGLRHHLLCIMQLQM